MVKMENDATSIGVGKFQVQELNLALLYQPSQILNHQQTPILMVASGSKC